MNQTANRTSNAHSISSLCINSTKLSNSTLFYGITGSIIPADSNAFLIKYLRLFTNRVLSTSSGLKRVCRADTFRPTIKEPYARHICTAIDGIASYDPLHINVVVIIILKLYLALFLWSHSETDTRFWRCMLLKRCISYSLMEYVNIPLTHR